MFKRILLTAAIMIGMMGAAVSQNLTRYQIRVINNSSYTVLNVYARNLETDRLYGDLLGTSVIPPGGVWTVNLDDSTGACSWRLQANMTNGADLRRNMNVCSTASWTITN